MLMDTLLFRDIKNRLCSIGKILPIRTLEILVNDRLSDSQCNQPYIPDTENKIRSYDVRTTDKRPYSLL